MSIEAMKQALEALEQLDGVDTETECVTIDVGDVMEALRQAIEKSATQEPVAWRFQSAVGGWAYGKEPPIGSKYAMEPLYTHPQPKAELLIEIDGEVMTIPQAAMLELYKFQEATGCDTADELAQPKAEQTSCYCPNCEALSKKLAEPKREWVGLTDEEVGVFKGEYQSGRIGSFVDLTKTIEAKLKEKNT